MLQGREIRTQETDRCFLCGMRGSLLYEDLRDRLFGVPGRWNMMHCSACDLVWLNPRPLAESIFMLYRKYYTHAKPKDPLNRLEKLLKVCNYAILESSFGYSNLPIGRFTRVLGAILSCIGPIKEISEFSVMTLSGERKGKLLDIGCGNGRFLAKMRELGWEVVGVDLDAEAVRMARDEFGLNVCKGSLEEAGFPDACFDAITMNHVIEHMYDPLDTLRECRRVLKYGGKLVIVTPNIKSLGHKLFGQTWVGLDPPRHLQIFSPKALQKCVDKSGFKIVELRTVAKFARWTWASSRLLKKSKELSGGQPSKRGFRLRLEEMVFYLIEFELCRFKNIGEEIVLIASKENRQRGNI